MTQPSDRPGEFYFEATNIGDWRSRAVFLIVGFGLAAIFVIALFLEPNPLGHSTHTQLGLAPCGFLVVTGLPCPGCGLTTCFTHLVRFEIADAARANPFGIPLFMFFGLAMGFSFLGAWRGWSVIESLYRYRFDWLCLGLCACAVVVWGARVATLLVSAL